MSYANTHYSNYVLDSIFRKAKKIFFVGIGGISMSSLAEYCVFCGKDVFGYDRVRTKICEKLEAVCHIRYCSSPDSVVGMDMVVYTGALNEENFECKNAERLGIPTVSRANFLGYIMSPYKTRIGIAGMHGKSTTTSMLAHIFEYAAKDPTVFCGAEMTEFCSASKFGKKDYFIFEACEYMDSFLNFYPTDAAVVNVDFDHPDFFKSIEQITESFNKYICVASRAYINADDPKSKELSHSNKISFGIDCDAMYKAKIVHSAGENFVSGNINYDETVTEYTKKEEDLRPVKNNAVSLCSEKTDDICKRLRKSSDKSSPSEDAYGETECPSSIQGNKKSQKKENGNVFEVFRNNALVAKCTLHAYGKHNIYDALCAFAIAYENGIEAQVISDALSCFEGSRRRMEFLKITETGAHLFEDYAHHPTEIKASLQALDEMGFKKILCIFQSHTYSRTYSLYKEFTESFRSAKDLIVAPIYAAREKNIYPFTDKGFAKDCGGKFMQDFSQIADYVKFSDADAVVIMGAGDIDSLKNLIK